MEAKAKEYFSHSLSISFSVNNPFSDYLATCTVLINRTILMNEDPALNAPHIDPPPEKT